MMHTQFAHSRCTLTCIFTMHTHFAHSWCTHTLYSHDAHALCTVTMHTHFTQSRCTHILHIHDVHTLCTVMMHPHFFWYKTVQGSPSATTTPLFPNSLLLLNHFLKIYFKKEIITSKSNDPGFLISHNFWCSELIRQWVRTGGTFWCVDSCQVQTHSISVSQCE